MARLFHRGRKKVAQSPGTLEYTGAKQVDKVRLTVINYDEDHYHQGEVDSVEKCLPDRDTAGVSWINVDGLHETKVLETLGGHFQLHPLVLEDIASPHQRPKMEEYQGYLFLVLRMLQYKDDEDVILSEQFSLVLGPGFVLSFQETPGDVFEPVRARIRQGKGRSRKMGADYLAYALVDAVVDSYFVILEKLSDRIESLEEELVENPGTEHLHLIHHLKREIILLRKSIWPLREVANRLERGESDLVQEVTRVFLRDVYDHTVQAIEMVESFRDVLGGMQDLYLSSLSNRMNEVMKVLTIAATIFVPLTFFAGVYGMNFEFMPELRWKYGYPLFWAAMLALTGVMVGFFRRKKWL